MSVAIVAPTFVPTFTKPVVRPNYPNYNPAPSTKWVAEVHPLEAQITKEVDDYFLGTWNFPNEKARKTFVNAGFSRVTCFYYPKALNDRIAFACKLLTVLFLVDDVLEEMSFEEGEAYNERLIPISRGHVLPNREDPAEYILYDLWEAMRAHDKELADEILEPTFTFMRAQTDKARATMKELGQYLEYRERDVGKALLSALMRFAYNIHLTQEELDSVREHEQNCSKQISVVNDIYSFEKELIASQTGHIEGSALCSAVSILADETTLAYEPAKKCLWTMVREWEDRHDEIVEERINAPQGCTEDVKMYMKGLEYQMSGNEEWSRTTLRYIGVDGQ